MNSSKLARLQARERRWVQKGQGLIEYALIILFVAIVVVGALALLGPAIGRMIGSVLPAL